MKTIIPIDLINDTLKGQAMTISILSEGQGKDGMYTHVVDRESIAYKTLVISNVLANDALVAQEFGLTNTTGIVIILSDVYIYHVPSLYHPIILV